MTETRWITFEGLQDVCWLTAIVWRGDDRTVYCKHDVGYDREMNTKCTAANCPIWKGLKKEG